LIFFSSASRMRVHGLGKVLCLELTYIMKYPPRRPGGWLRAPVKKAVYLLADGTLSVLRNAPPVLCAVDIGEREFQTRPCGIVAQNIFVVQKSSRAFFSRTRFGTRSRAPVKCQGCNCNSTVQQRAASFPERAELRTESGEQKLRTDERELRTALCPQPSRHLYSTFALTLSRESGAAIFHAQAYIPTQPAQAKQEAWLSHAHEDPGRQKGDFPPRAKGASGSP